jgi:hypothetical protein
MFGAFDVDGDIGAQFESGVGNETGDDADVPRAVGMDGVVREKWGVNFKTGDGPGDGIHSRGRDQQRFCLRSRVGLI